MKWKNWGIQGGVAVAVMAAVVGCMPVQPVTPTTGESTTPEVTEVATQATIATDDPFAYCAAVGTIDAPDERFTGADVPDVIAEGVRSAFGAEDVDLEVYQRGTFWRCMDGNVYACNVGANLPCESKADESREPTQPMVDFCAENAGSDFIPAVVTGRMTVYAWACDDTTPVIVDQVTEVDSQGYLQSIWHELTPLE